MAKSILLRGPSIRGSEVGEQIESRPYFNQKRTRMGYSVEDKPRKRRFSLKAKFGIVFGIFFLITAGILGTSCYYIFRLKDAAQTINLASSERMRSFKLAFLLNQYVKEGQGEVRSSLRHQIDEELARFEEIMYGLRDGSKELKLSGVKNTGEFTDAYNSLTRHIEVYQNELRPKILRALDSPSPVEVQEGLAEVNRLVPPLVHDIDRTVNIFEAESRGKLFRFLTLELNLISVAIILTGLSLFFVVLTVLRPIEKIKQGMGAFSQGNWKERISIRTRDELGELAEGFNEMAEELAQDYRVLQEQNEQIKEFNKLLSESCVTDPLTGLYNYYYFQETLKTEYQGAKRYAHPLSLLVIDLDYFKTVNDLWGHSFGDFVLKEIANLMRKQLRASDIACRIGGEEFAILLPSTKQNGALEAGEKLRKAAADHTFSQKGESCTQTITIGCSSADDPATSTEIHLFKHADEALMEGKKRGRNTLVSWTQVCLNKIAVKGIDKEGLVEYRERFLIAEKNHKRAYIDTTLAFLKALDVKD
ncbi:MAG TPA: diguanylate cyclase, partial [Candidatus Hypogeohydataceae bacterium YC40]